MDCGADSRARDVFHASVVTRPMLEGVDGRLLLLVVSLAGADAYAQSASTVISVTARIVAHCTVSSTNPRSTCSEKTLSRQGDVSPASARISTSDNEATVTHTGGFPPTIEKMRDRILLSF